MIEMVSTRTLSAREPDHSESRKPTEIRSERPEVKTSSTVGARDESMILGEEAARRTRVIGSRTLLDGAGAEPPSDVADATEEPQDERGKRQQREEAGLRGEPGDAVAQADTDRLHHEPRQRPPQGTAPAIAEGSLRVGHPSTIAARAGPRRDTVRAADTSRSHLSRQPRATG